MAAKELAVLEVVQEARELERRNVRNERPPAKRLLKTKKKQLRSCVLSANAKLLPEVHYYVLQLVITVIIEIVVTYNHVILLSLDFSVV